MTNEKDPLKSTPDEPASPSNGAFQPVIEDEETRALVEHMHRNIRAARSKIKRPVS